MAVEARRNTSSDLSIKRLAVRSARSSPPPSAFMASRYSGLYWIRLGRHQGPVIRAEEPVMHGTVGSLQSVLGLGALLGAQTKDPVGVFAEVLPCQIVAHRGL
jgi:hypothetical protein